MKSLKNYVQEGLLDDVETVLADNNVLTKIYPIPSVKDFKKTYVGDKIRITWKCGKIIQQYIHMLDSIKNPAAGAYNTERLTTIKVYINTKDKYIETYLCDDSEELTQYLIGVGDCESSLPNAKKETLAFFRHLANNPESMKTVFEYVLKCEKELKQYGVCDNKTFKNILKY